MFQVKRVVRSKWKRRVRWGDFGAFGYLGRGEGADVEVFGLFRWLMGS